MKATGFGYNNAWLAVKTDDPDRVAATLGLTNLVPCAWAAGIQAAYGENGLADKRIFVTPTVAGWVFCIGIPLFDYADMSPRFDTLATRLSAELATEVHYFATHRVVEMHAWARARNGQLERAYMYAGESGEVPINSGQPTESEQQLGLEFSAEANDRFPDEDDVIKLAGAWGLSPAYFEEHVVDVGSGFTGVLDEPDRRPDTGSGTPGKPDSVIAPQTKRPWWKFW